MRKIMLTLHRLWWVFILVGIYILWNSLDLLRSDIYWKLHNQQEIIKDCITWGVLFLFFFTTGIVLGLHKKRYNAKYKESMHSSSLNNKTEATNKISSQIRKINNYYYKFDILSDETKIELRWEDYGTGNRLGWISRTFEISHDEKTYTSVEDICKSILQAVRDRQPYKLITDEEYEEELQSLIIYFNENCVNAFPHLNKKGMIVIKTLKNVTTKADTPSSFCFECTTETIELVCDKSDNLYICNTFEVTTAENNGRPSTRRNIKRFDTNITFENFLDVTDVNYKDYITSEFIAVLYSKSATPYDRKDIRLYKKYDEDIYFIRLDGTAYNTGGTLYFDLEKGYFNNHSIEDFCDFIQKKCFMNDDSYPDFREIIKQNHTILKLFKS